MPRGRVLFAALQDGAVAGSRRVSWWSPRLIGPVWVERLVFIPVVGFSGAGTTRLFLTWDSTPRANALVTTNAFSPEGQSVATGGFTTTGFATVAEATMFFQPVSGNPGTAAERAIILHQLLNASEVHLGFHLAKDTGVNSEVHMWVSLFEAVDPELVVDLLG
jgi:hypothetical protein